MVFLIIYICVFVVDPSSLQSVSSTDASPPSITVTELSKSEPIPPKKVVQLTLVNLQATSIAPKESVTYEKQTQTQALGSDRGGKIYLQQLNSRF